MAETITENICRTARHTTFYLEAGPANGTPIIFVHGWPELAISWRQQITTFAALGFRVIAPDLRGFGRSSIHQGVEHYTIEQAVNDLLELLDHVGANRAIWVGHDFGAAVVWGLASHHPEKCIAVSNLSVPYLPDGFTLETVGNLANRDLYPVDQYPYGQWGYWAYNVEYPDDAAAALESDVMAAVRVIFGRGNPEMSGKPTPGGSMSAPEGWWPLIAYGKKKAVDEAIFSPGEYASYVAALTNSGFAAGLGFYRNNAAHADYASRAVNGGRLDMPVLFIHALHDPSCSTMFCPLPVPMRSACSDLEERIVEAGHWVQQENGRGVNAALLRWLATRVPEAWDRTGASIS